MRPIQIEYSENRTDLKHRDTIELVELINLFFSDNYKLKVKNEDFILDLKKRTDNWYDYKDYEQFKKDLIKKIDKNNNGSYEVLIKNSRTSIEYAFFNSQMFIEKSGFSLCRFISNGNYLITYFHNGQTNEEIDLLKTDLGQLYEAIPVEGTTSYEIGEPIEIEILKKLESNRYRFDFFELDRISEYSKKNNLTFRLIDIGDI